MLSKIIKLEDIKDDFNDPSMPGDTYITGQFIEVTIEAFKTLTDEVVRLKEMVKSQLYQITNLQKRIKKLEQQDEEEIKNMKVGGTD